MKTCDDGFQWRWQWPSKSVGLLLFRCQNWKGVWRTSEVICIIGTIKTTDKICLEGRNQRGSHAQGDFTVPKTSSNCCWEQRRSHQTFIPIMTVFCYGHNPMLVFLKIFFNYSLFVFENMFFSSSISPIIFRFPCKVALGIFENLRFTEVNIWTLHFAFHNTFSTSVEPPKVELSTPLNRFKKH